MIMELKLNNKKNHSIQLKLNAIKVGFHWRWNNKAKYKVEILQRDLEQNQTLNITWLFIFCI